uniref:ARAD1C09790p n=1 Tax=Blastobotrys adeninivorans TaxID=409370 RepID=A0A060T0P1_BLAAD
MVSTKVITIAASILASMATALPMEDTAGYVSSEVAAVANDDVSSAIVMDKRAPQPAQSAQAVSDFESHLQRLDGLSGSLENARQKMNSLMIQIREHPEHAGAEVATAAIQGLDSQIDNGIATIGNFLAPVTGGLSRVVANAILGPFVQSVTDGAEVVLGNVIGGAFDAVAAPIRSMTQNIGRLIQQARANNMDVSRLEQAQTRLQNALAHGSSHGKQKRAGNTATFDEHIQRLDGLTGALQNRRQQINALANRIREHPEHANAAIVTAAIQGLDSQIDNGIATIGNFLAPITGGLSKAVANVLLGPFVQSVTDGAEVVLGNMIGGAMDAMAAPARRMSQNISRLIQQARANNMDVSRLEKAHTRLQQAIARH